MGNENIFPVSFLFNFIYLPELGLSFNIWDFSAAARGI